MDKFSGDMGAYRMWMFNFTVALSQIDGKLSEEVRKLINRNDLGKLPESWDPSEDPGIDSDTYTKFKTELYGVLVSLTSGEPLGILKGLQDKDFPSDGFKAL
eukprot:9337637-Karenia_brevis.AAC.1